MHKKPRSKKILLGIRLFCFLILSVSGTLLARDLHRYHREESANRKLADRVQQARSAGTSDPDVSSSDSRFGIYADLHQENSDFTGWLYIEDTRIDYPVMYTPQDPEHYLYRAFDGSYAKSGSLFIDAACLPDTNHIMIHGHHMKDKSMFGSLPNYQTQDYAEEHSVIRYDTLAEAEEYELLSAFYTEINSDQEESGFRYYEYTDLSDPTVFKEYISQVKNKSLYDSDTEAVYGDKILTLSTCSYHTEDGRFVIVAVKHDWQTYEIPKTERTD